MSAPSWIRTACPELAALLEARKDALVTRWVARVTLDLGEAFPPDALVDGLPEILEVLISTLRRGTGPRGGAGELPDVGAAGERHGAQRQALGVDVSRMVWEYAELRHVVLDLAEEAGRTLTLDEVRVLTDVVASGISGSMRAYAAAQRARLRSAEARFATIADHAPAAIFVKDADGRYRFVNRFTAELLRAARQELIGRQQPDLFPAPARASPEAGAEGEGGPERGAAADDPGPGDVTGEQTVETPDGRRVFHVVQFALPGREREVAGIGIDVTARKAAELEARRAAELLELGDPFFELDPAWRVVRVNANQERLLRRSRADTLGRVVWDLWPEAGDDSSAFWRECHRVMEERVPRRFEAHHPPVGVWLDVTAYPVSRGGIAVFFRDVTERKSAERELGRAVALLEGALGGAPVGLAFVDRHRRFVRVNEVLARMCGVTVEDTIGRTIREVVPALAPRFEAIHRRILESGEPLLDQELNRDREGERADWLVSHYPIRLPGDPQPFAVGSVVVDITEQKRAERDAASTRDFERQLLGIVSHDLRNPLSAVVLATRLLLTREDLTPVHRASVTRIQTAAERAVRLVHDLLDLTQARLGGGIPVAPQDVDAREVVQGVLDELQPSFGGHHVRLRVEGPTAGRWDPDRLGQVVSNLLANALKFSPPDSEVDVSLAGDAEAIRLSVHNDGAPIAPELLPCVFEQWRRAHASAGGGLGLGLYISERIVAAHGGALGVTSTAEAGTTFTAHLPRAGDRHPGSPAAAP